MVSSRLASASSSLRALRPDEFAFLCDIFEPPQVLDPRAWAQAVTKEIAVTLAEVRQVG